MGIIKRLRKRGRDEKRRRGCKGHLGEREMLPFDDGCRQYCICALVAVMALGTAGTAQT